MTRTYTVHRAMQDGANAYEPGDTRELSEADAAELVAMGALSLEGEEPIAREPVVVHTFGEGRAEDAPYVSAVEQQPRQSVTLERKPKTKA